MRHGNTPGRLGVIPSMLFEWGTKLQPIETALREDLVTHINLFELRALQQLWDELHQKEYA